jgi:hypothetical protein
MVKLDSPLLIKELDKSMNQANMKSVPGIDGMSNVFLKEYRQDSLLIL